MKKNTTLAAVLMMLAGMGLGSCATEQSLEPTQNTFSAEKLEGTWRFKASDGEDISSYQITYTFDDQSWQYTMPNVGTKVYSYSAADGKLSAALLSSSFPSSEKVGTSFDAAYTITGDTLMISYDGHEGLLVRMAPAEIAVH